MSKWYQGIVVNHKEEEGKLSHWFDDENFKILCEERVEQLKEIERLNEKIEELMQLYTTEREVKEDYKSIIKEVREYITSQKLHKFQDTTGGLTYDERKLLEILDKGE